MKPKTLLRAWNLYPKKNLGQNFISNPSVSQMITEFAEIQSDEIVLDIGAGLGALTIPAAKKAERVYAVEKDTDMTRLLKTEIIAKDISNIDLINTNILKFDLNSLELNRKITVTGALPYNISSQIIVWLIDFRKVVNKAVLILQKEMAVRLLARSGNRDYGRLTVMLNFCCDIKKLTDIRADTFFPKPNVDSTVIKLEFKEKYKGIDEKKLFKVIKAGFSKRRKTLRNALAGNILNLDTTGSQKLLESAGIEQSRRAETLSIEEFIKLSECQ